MARRLDVARAELGRAGDYTHVIENIDPDKAARDICEILVASENTTDA